MSSGSVNKVILMGRLGRDPECRRMNSGDRVCNIRLATSESWRDKQTGERREKAEWHSVVIMNDALVETAERYLQKGDRIYVEGKLQTRKWADDKGVERFSTEIVVGRFNATLNIVDCKRWTENRQERGGREDGAPDDGGGYDEGGGFGSGGGGAPRRPAVAGGGRPMDDDEIPF